MTCEAFRTCPREAGLQLLPDTGGVLDWESRASLSNVALAGHAEVRRGFNPSRGSGFRAAAHDGAAGRPAWVRGMVVNKAAIIAEASWDTGRLINRITSNQQHLILADCFQIQI